MSKSPAIFIALILSLVGAPIAAYSLPTKADKQIVRITASGFKPATLNVSKGDATVFFFNETGQSLEKFSIKFGKNRIHCHNPSLFLDSDGYLRNNQPILPNSFVLACFPDSENYKVSAAVGTKTYGASIIVPKQTEEK